MREYKNLESIDFLEIFDTRDNIICDLGLVEKAILPRS